LHQYLISIKCLAVVLDYSLAANVIALNPAQYTALIITSL